MTRFIDLSIPIANDLISGPDAAPFYYRSGAIDSGQAASGSIPGRVLPLTIMPISGRPNA